jgi:RNA polymerase sigma-70 factor (ECF subfamily)
MREKRVFSSLVSLEEIEVLTDKDQGRIAVEQHLTLAKLSILIRRLKPLDRQVIVCWLEGIDAESIGEITGLSPANVAVRVNRIKKILAHRFRQGGSDGR